MILAFVSMLVSGLVHSTHASESPHVSCEVHKYSASGSRTGLLGDVDHDGRTLIRSAVDGLTYEAIFTESSDRYFDVVLSITDTERGTLITRKAGPLSADQPVLSASPYERSDFVCSFVR